MANDIRLRAPLQVTGDDVERALFEQSMEELTVARVFDRLRGVASGRAAEELNRALDVDIFEVLTEGWAKVPAVRNAVHLSALVKGPPALVNVDRHDISSNSRIVLDSSVGQSVLPPLRRTTMYADPSRWPEPTNSIDTPSATSICRWNPTGCRYVSARCASASS